MTWTVNYAESARQDLREILGYISEMLLEPAIAANQVTRIMDSADSLDQMPFRHRLYDYEPWRSRGLRIMPVDNYVVLYMPDESIGIVNIIRVMYRRRDINKHFIAD
jgi:toxin ParE1/3/4